ncbi:c-type cytochrome biogenesis protein CcmI [Marinobacter pelagius]|uniref:Cytochrome c-type biogenesis protein CcmH n=1 Tax=Marinobacter pelagius TaxID=379482 RepID=A0A1I4TS39_9GAMM|nr:c-type cytochrome biogenesis protein CcmI [Marinobacter pelagius]SFM79509.1 cytochrome c-type biogenesis protein CcmH [Marinobacter pelagius]
MTNTFWIAATVLIIIALAFVLFPVLFQRADARARADIRNQNLMAYRTRMKELDDEFEAGILDEDNYRQLKEELAGSMLDDVPESEQPRRAVPGRKSAIAVALVSVLVLPGAAYYLYQEWGAMDRVEQYIAMQQMEQSDSGRQAQMSDLVVQLRDRLEADPDNPDGWAMLGQSYMRLEQYQEAAWAFRQLAKVVDGNDQAEAVALGLSAQALFFDSQGAMTEAVTEAIRQARSLNPDEVNALGLLGINAFSQQNYREAIEYWERIVAVAPDHPQIASIRGGINEAYNRLGETPPEVQAPADAGGPGVTVEVALADAFQDQVPADTTLFVFAREAGNPNGPPLAVERLTAGDLPATLRLDDGDSMSPQMKISGAGQVLVTARLSRTGSVQASAGDWQGSVDEPVTVSGEDTDPVRLVIDQQLTN